MKLKITRKLGYWLVAIGILFQVFNILTYGLFGIDIDVIGLLILIVGLIILIIKWIKK